MADPDLPSPSIKELPPEIWKKILSNLDTPSLLKCRLVNKCWKGLSNEVLQEPCPLWRLDFECSVALFSIPPGTLFSTSEKLTRFMEEMKDTPNPFPHGTVIINPNPDLTMDQIKSFLGKAYELLDTFQDDILNLVYRLEIEGMEEVSTSEYFISQQLLNILCLKNLKRLALEFYWSQYKTLWSIRSQKLFQKLLEDATLPENLTELYISCGNPIAPLFYMFNGSESILKSVENLAMANGFHSPHLKFEMRQLQFPNLKKLKVGHPEAKLLKQFQQFQPSSVASLREVSFSFEEIGESMYLNVKESFELLDLHAKTLEVLHFEFPGSFLDDPKIFSDVKYENLRKLVFWYYDLDRQPAAISALMAKLVNLLEVKLLLELSQPDDDEQIRPRDHYDMVMACWDTFPATVRVVHVPLYGWRLKRGDTLNFD